MFVSADSMLDEARRLSLLESYAPDSLQDDPELLDITRFAAKLCGAPTALVSLVEAQRQRFLAREGLDAPETPRNVSFCQHAMTMDRVMEVTDAAIDPRFADNALVTGPPFIRFYAGAPLVGEEGEALGALCIISPDPRPGGLTSFQREGLLVLAQAVMRRLKDRRTYLERAASEARFSALGDAMPQMAWSTPANGQTDYFNRRWQEFTGADPADHYGAGWIEAVHPDDRAAAAAAWKAAVESGQPYEVEYRLRRHDGEWRWTLARGLPMHDGGGAVVRWFGTNTDIHEHKTLIESRDLLTRELSHRIKNIFSLVASLLHIEAKANPAMADVVHKASARIAALGRAHDYVRPDRSEGARTSLKGVLTDLFAAYADAGEPRVELAGDDLKIREEAVTPLALLFHELATNAAKYGALSVPGGRVTLDIAVEGGTTHFRWIEAGGPDASAAGDKANGFGHRLIGTAVEHQLKGKLERVWAPGGLTAKVTVPTSRLACLSP